MEQLATPKFSFIESLLGAAYADKEVQASLNKELDKIPGWDGLKAMTLPQLITRFFEVENRHLEVFSLNDLVLPERMHSMIDVHLDNLDNFYPEVSKAVDIYMQAEFDRMDAEYAAKVH
jgi:hypothetical protein